MQFKLVDEDSGDPLPGATAFVSEEQGGVADTNGLVLLENLKEGSITIRFSFVGYESISRSFTIPYPGGQPIAVALEHHHQEMEEVTVAATRSSRNIEDIPTRIEFLGAEELEEKSVMRSANIAMLLRESTGIQMQVTSPSTANQSIRIQGLDGRYTQLMKDGFPLYSGFSGGLSIMQIPPLDLRQVEVIKGSNSTLYGGGAIAGIVNLVSLQPEEKSRLKVMLDQTSARGTTLNAFYSGKREKLAWTLFGSGHRQEPYDPNGDSFSDIPQIRSLTLNPTFFAYPNESSRLRLSFNGSLESRQGGILSAIESNSGSSQNLLEKNFTRRMSYQFSYDHKQLGGGEFNFKNSLLRFDRDIDQFDYNFEGEQLATFSEASYSVGEPNSHWLFGANYYSDRFEDGRFSTYGNRDYDQNTAGIFVQQNQDLGDSFSMESGFRLDQNDDYGWFALPRIAFLAKINPKLSSRLGGGLGYKTPTIFIEETERTSFRDLDAGNLADLAAERSYGGNYDINYKTTIGQKWTLSLNQLFFYTQLTDPIVLRRSRIDVNNPHVFFENAEGPVRTRGIESNLKLTYQDFKLFLNYALLDTELGYDNINEQKPLTAKHNLGAVLVYEEHGKWRVGLEAYYTGQQFRNDYTRTDDYWIVGLMVLRKFEDVGIYINFENFTDTRQSKFETIDLSISQSHSLIDIWAPMDGFIINTGFIWEF